MEFVRFWTAGVVWVSQKELGLLLSCELTVGHRREDQNVSGKPLGNTGDGAQARKTTPVWFCTHIDGSFYDHFPFTLMSKLFFNASVQLIIPLEIPAWFLPLDYCRSLRN